MQMYIMPWSRILGKLLVAQIIQNFQPFIENEGFVFTVDTYPEADGFGGLVVSMLASGTQVCRFKPG